MRISITILLVFTLADNSFGQVTEKNILGKWFLTKFQVDSMLTIDKHNPTNVVLLNINQLKNVKPGYSSSDSVEYANQIMSRMKVFENYFLEFLEDGTYQNTKLARGQKTNGVQSGKFRLKESNKILVQVDADNRTTESSIEINNSVLKIFMNIADKKTIMTFEQIEKNAR